MVGETFATARLVMLNRSSRPLDAWLSSMCSIAAGILRIHQVWIILICTVNAAAHLSCRLLSFRLFWGQQANVHLLLPRPVIVLRLRIQFMSVCACIISKQNKCSTVGPGRHLLIWNSQRLLD